MDKSSIYATLREKIVLGDYKPGQVLKEKRLMEEFHIGRTPLRELLIRLNTEGLIEMFPHAGIYVSSVDFQHLVDVVEVRRPLIRMSGQLVAERATSEEIKQMKDWERNGRWSPFMRAYCQHWVCWWHREADSYRIRCVA